MRPLTDTLPKALLPVCGRPFAHWQLARLAHEGVRRVVYSIGVKGDMIRAFVGDGAAWGLEVGYVDEGTNLRGTAGALRKALDAGALDEAFFVLYGDSYLPIALAPVAAAFRAAGTDTLMTVFRNAGRWDTSNVLFENGRVTLYDKAGSDPRAPRMQYIDYGLSVIARRVVEAIPADGITDLATLYHDLSVAGALAGYEVHDRFYEVGSPDGLRDLERHLADTSLSS
jgi:NDP-sugar pyrophosphorylase family protein